MLHTTVRNYSLICFRSGDCTSENKQTRERRGRQEESISYFNSRGDSSLLCSKETHRRTQTHTHKGIAYGSRLRECDRADVDLMAFSCSVWWNLEAVWWCCVGVSKMSYCNMPQVKFKLWTYWVKIRSRLQGPARFDYNDAYAQLLILNCNLSKLQKVKTYQLFLPDNSP